MPSIYTWDRVLTSPEAYAFNSSEIRAHDKVRHSLLLSFEIFGVSHTTCETF